MHRYEYRKLHKFIGIALLYIACLGLYGCSSSVGIGLSVGVPIGNHGYISIGSSHWR